MMAIPDEGMIYGSNMAKEKLKNKKDYLSKLCSPLKGIIFNEFIPNSPDMSHNRIAELSLMSKNYHRLFQPILNNAKDAYPLLLSVVQGNPDTLIEQVRTKPEFLFKKGQITDLSGQTFYNVSPFQLMIFLCDVDMIYRVMPLILQKINMENRHVLKVAQNQYAEIKSGGADLVKINRDPTQLDFTEITQFKENYYIHLSDHSLDFSLLENPNGIIHYCHPVTKNTYFYFANRKTRSIEPLEMNLSTEEAQIASNQLSKLFAEMGNNTSRRSSNEEYNYIKQITKPQHHLFRQGIQYESHGVLYRDTRIEFKQINAYRKCLQLNSDYRYGLSDEYWRKEVGTAQRQVLWVLQRICEPRRFYPLPDFYASAFQRSFEIVSECSKENSILVNGKLTSNLGSKYAIKKAGIGTAFASNKGVVGPGFCPVRICLLGVNWIVEDAKKRVNNLKPLIEFMMSNDLSSEKITL